MRLAPLLVRRQPVPQMEEVNFKFRFLFTSEEIMQREPGRQRGAATEAAWSLYRSVMVKRELVPKVKLSIYWSIHVPTLNHGQEPSVMTAVTRRKTGVSSAGWPGLVLEKG